MRATADIRSDFHGLGGAEVPLDGAAGTKVPEAVVAAVAEAMLTRMANQGGAFVGSALSTQVLVDARAALADLVGGDPDGVVLGPNMTTLTFHLADAFARDWGPGDEVVVTSLDHDANVRPWVLAAERAGATVRVAEFDPESGELAPEAFDPVLCDRTRLVAVTAASNAIGTRPDVRAIADRAHAAGALVYVDGVHATPHTPIDVAALGADLYACSSYKFCGPHAGAVIADPAVLERLSPAKLIPAPDRGPGRFERGTPSFEALAGVAATVDWLAELESGPGTRRERLLASLAAVEARLDALGDHARAGLTAIDGVRVLGAPARRTPTLSFTVEGHTPRAVAEALAAGGIAVWSGDNYAYELMDRYGLADSGGAVRASFVLYNDEDDAERLLSAVGELAA